MLLADSVIPYDIIFIEAQKQLHAMQATPLRPLLVAFAI